MLNFDNQIRLNYQVGLSLSIGELEIRTDIYVMPHLSIQIETSLIASDSRILDYTVLIEHT